MNWELLKWGVKNELKKMAVLKVIESKKEERKKKKVNVLVAAGEGRRNVGEEKSY